MKIIPKYDQGGYLQYFAQYTAAQSSQVAPQRAAKEERPAKAAKQEKDEMLSSKDLQMKCKYQCHNQLNQ